MSISQVGSPGERPGRHPGRICRILMAICMLSAMPERAAAGTAAPAPSLSREQRAAVEALGAAYIRGLNAGGPSDARTVEAVFAPETVRKVGLERLLDQLASVRERMAPLEYHHSEVVESTRAGRTSRILHVYARRVADRRWRQFQFRLEPAPPYRITELAFIAEVAEPVYLPNGDLIDPGTRDWVDGYITRLAGEEQLSGSVLVTRGGKPVLERVFGFADARRSRPITLGTRFNLGSGNKMMTAVAVAQLAEKGKLAFTDSIVKYLPDYPDTERARKVTIHHLLSHTSGIGEYWTEEYEKHWNGIRTPADQLPWVYRAGFDFDPGARFAYSNSNFVLAGRIVEKVSGMSYYDYVRKYITRPAGMTETDFPLMDGSASGLAERLRRAGEGWEDAPHGLRGGPAGGGYSTARDMARFIQALVAGKLVSAATLETMTTSKTADLPGGMDYGYGFILSRSGPEVYYGHGGFAPGVNFELAYFPSSATILAMFCNQDNGAYDDLKKNLIKLISGDR